MFVNHKYKNTFKTVTFKIIWTLSVFWQFTAYQNVHYALKFNTMYLYANLKFVQH